MKPRSASTFDELMQRGLRYALSLTHNVHEAEELLQDSCLAISRKNGPWKSGYLFKAIRHRYIDATRRRKIVQFTPLCEGNDAAAPPARLEERDQLEHALGSLKTEERELLFLHAVEGYTATELSTLTKRPRGSILSLLHRAKAKVKQLLSQEAKEANG